MCGAKSKPFWSMVAFLSAITGPEAPVRYTTDFPGVTLPLTEPAMANCDTSAKLNNGTSTFTSFMISSLLSTLKDPLQPSYGGVGTERLDSHRQSRDRVGNDGHDLLRANLIFE